MGDTGNYTDWRNEKGLFEELAVVTDYDKRSTAVPAEGHLSGTLLLLQRVPDPLTEALLPRLFALRVHLSLPLLLLVRKL